MRDPTALLRTIGLMLIHRKHPASSACIVGQTSLSWVHLVLLVPLSEPGRIRSGQKHPRERGVRRSG